MIKKYEIAMWALISGTVGMAACFSRGAYGVVVDYDIEGWNDPEMEEMLSEAPDLPLDDILDTESEWDVAEDMASEENEDVTEDHEEELVDEDEE